MVQSQICLSSVMSASSCSKNPRRPVFGTKSKTLSIDLRLRLAALCLLSVKSVKSVVAFLWLRLAALRSFAAKIRHLYSTDYQPLAINPASHPSKPPQKTTVSAAKTAFPPNYFCNRISTFPTPIATLPLFFRVLVVVLPLLFAMKIVPTVGMTNFGNHAVIVP